jgi:hypothetical protein
MFGGKQAVVAALDGATARVGFAQLEMLRLIPCADELGAWRDDGARDLPHWLGMRYGISS